MLGASLATTDHAVGPARSGGSGAGAASGTNFADAGNGGLYVVLLGTASAGPRGIGEPADGGAEFRSFTSSGLYPVLLGAGAAGPAVEPVPIGAGDFSAAHNSGLLAVLSL